MDEFQRDFNLYHKALSGDYEATRMYCGSYTLVRRIGDGHYFRCKGDVPIGHIKVQGRYIYDTDGFLQMQYWSLPRI